MADLEFNTTEGQTIARELLVVFLNTGTAEVPVWSSIGRRVESSDMEMDWSQESSQDILGSTWTTMKKPIITQPFNPWPLDAGDPAVVKLWNLGIKDQDAQALANQDVLIVHRYVKAGSGESSVWAERYSSCAIPINRNGGDGGGNITIGSEITYGGTRTLGTVTESAGTVTFTPDE